MAKYRGRLRLSYDGTSYGGWQKQKTKNPPTIQGELESALSRIFDDQILVVGSGRTDAGTHARSQECHFDAAKPLTQFKDLRRSLNQILPSTILVRQAWQAPEDFHALHSAERKTYVYRIWNSPLRSVWLKDRAHWVAHPLHLGVLQSLSAELLGELDFASFQTKGTEVASTIRTIYTVEWRRPRPHLVEFRITGSGFLKQMVRNIVGTLLYLHDQEHKGKPAPALAPRFPLIEPSLATAGTASPALRAQLRTILTSRNRQAAKTTAPARGLYLWAVTYPPALDKRCRKL